MKKLLILSSIVLLLIPNIITISDSSFSIDHPPRVEILFPKNGTIVYEREVDISIKCTDDKGIRHFIFDPENEYVNHAADHFTWGESQKVFFYNDTVTFYKGNNSFQVYAYDEHDNEGYNISICHYNVTKDLYPPTIAINPKKGKLIIRNEEILSLPINISIIIGNFAIYGTCIENEAHLKNITLYIDNTPISDAEEQYFFEVFGLVAWGYDTTSFGMHEMKVEASDSYDNVASEQLDYFVIIF